MENSIYTVDYFIKKFTSIPEIMWCIRSRDDGNGRRCALGHAEDRQEEFVSLINLFRTAFPDRPTSFGCVSLINNGDHEAYRQPTPKQRILQALYDIKAKQQPQPEVKERIVYVMVDSTVKELSGQLTNN